MVFAKGEEVFSILLHRGRLAVELLISRDQRKDGGKNLGSYGSDFQLRIGHTSGLARRVQKENRYFLSQGKKEFVGVVKLLLQFHDTE